VRPHSKGDAPKENGGFTEVLSGNVRDIIKEYINIDLLNDSIDLTQEAKMDIVKTLEEKNIFQLKGAVTETAGLLNVSEPTIYRYRKLIANL
ncbi:MAG: helix-turn-helix domain-containing protein, partial [Tetragenococcus koreensis]|nr:helix-turn-helix domain-containing protein [Tetragenococcus koreensis]